MPTHDHKHLVLPGPVEVRREILEAQTEWMIGHRGTAFAELFARLQEKLRRAFLTTSRVIVSGSSGTGLWEGASRNCIRDDRKALHLVGGAFSERWAEVSKSNGKQVDMIEVEWGRAITPEMVEAALKKDRYDAVCVVTGPSAIPNSICFLMVAGSPHEPQASTTSASSSSVLYGTPRPRSIA